MGVHGETPAQIAILVAHRAALDPTARSHPPCLFHVGDDAGELRDRSAEFPAKVEEMRARAEATMAEIRKGRILPIITP